MIWDGLGQLGALDELDELGELGGHSLLGLVLGLIFKYFLLTDWGATPSPLMIENFLQKSL